MIRVCPRCINGQMFKDEDGWLCITCGYVAYVHVLFQPLVPTCESCGRTFLTFYALGHHRTKVHSPSVID